MTSSTQGLENHPPVPLFELATQYQNLRHEIEGAIRQVLDSTEYIGGKALAEFEKGLGHYLQASAVGVSSGTDALLASLMALGIGPGHEVITTPFTFFATAGSIRRVGAKPVFVDIDPETFLLNEAAIPAAINAQTRAIMPVHLYGQMADARAIAALAAPRNLAVIEDACQALGARDVHGEPIGARATAACLSFYPTKNLGAAGDAGALVTRDAQLAQRFRQTRQHGETERYHHAFVGGNFRLDGIQAAVLAVKLKYLETWNQQRRTIAAFYTKQFAGSEVRPPQEIPGAYHIYHQYVVRVPRRDALREHLTRLGIGSNIYYPKPLHLQACFDDLGYKLGAFPVAERAAGEVLALPIFPELSLDQCQRVVDAIRSFYRG